MAEKYVSVEGLKRKLIDEKNFYPVFVSSALKEMPEADVIEVKHGEWIEDGYYGNPCVCSNCGEEALYISRFEETFDYDWEENLQSTGYEEHEEYIKTPYCPNCGAKMDEK